MNCFIIFLFLTTIATSHQEIDLNNYKNIESILLRNPFVKQCDQPPEEIVENFDQMNVSCPLPLRTNTKDTGCLCNFKTNTIECIYSNRLNDFPKFVKPIYEKEPIVWNISLKCKNFTKFNSFGRLFVFERINVLDLSSLDAASSYSNCSFYDEKLNKAISLNDTTYLSKIGQIEQLVDQEIYSINNKLTIELLNLNANKIKRLYFNKKQFNFNLKQQVDIQSLSLTNNLIESLNITNIELCEFKIETLNIRNNSVNNIDFSYLIILKSLDLSHNNLTKFNIDFFNRYLNDEQNKCGIKELKINKNTIFVSNLKLFDLSFNKLVTLPFSYIKNVQFSLLEMLNVTSNNLKLIKNDEFVNFNHLKSLYLANNKIERIEPMSLNGLNDLNYLDLSYNLLSELPSNLFKFKTISLQTVKLNKNNLMALPRDAFKYLTSVKYLYMNFNKIDRLVNYSFGYMLNLLELYLSNNLIDTIEAHTFFIDEKSFIGPGLIEKLDLSHNRLTSLNHSAFSYLTNLRYLLLNNNLIKSIDNQAFYGVNYLIYLDLSINKLEKLQFFENNQNFSQLRYFKVAHNNLAYLEANTFLNLNSLKLLDLASNKINGFDDCAFNGLQGSIKNIILNYNQITTIKSCAFNLNFANMRIIQILHNPLDCSNNCLFFYSIYNYPYSVFYNGHECSFGTFSNSLDCTLSRYQNISYDCSLKLNRKKCSFKSNKHEFIISKDNVMISNYDMSLNAVFNASSRMILYGNCFLLIFVLIINLIVNNLVVI